MNVSDFDFDLPPDRVAQEPPPLRTDARMLVLDRGSGDLEHRGIGDLPDYLRPGDVLVLNDTRVIPARVFGHRRDTGGRVEVLFVEEVDGGEWDAFYRASRPPRVGQGLDLGGGALGAEIVAVHGGGRVRLRMDSAKPLLSALEQAGVPPLPPYIRRAAGGDERVQSDRSRYQTVYARHPGAVAAPTAGLHFTPELLERIAARGVRTAAVTLHVGPGTFKPVSAERVEDHRMEPERYAVSAEAAAAIREARAGGGRVVAVGSTSVRTLETVAGERGELVAAEGRSALFIYPGYRFRVVDAMLTNFHLPRSTLLMMVAAFAGRERVLRAYAEAIAAGYRFYSYGDCMLIQGKHLDAEGG